MNGNSIVDENKESFKRTSKLFICYGNVLYIFIEEERKSFIMTEETVETGSVSYALSCV